MKTTEYEKEFNKYKLGLEKNKVEPIFEKMHQSKDLTPEQLNHNELLNLNISIIQIKLESLGLIEKVSYCNNEINELYENVDYFGYIPFRNNTLDSKLFFFERLNDNQTKKKNLLEEYYENRKYIHKFETRINELNKLKKQ